MAPVHKRARVRRLAVGAAAAVASAALATGPASGLEVMRPAGSSAPVPPPAVPAPSVPSVRPPAVALPAIATPTIPTPAIPTPVIPTPTVPTVPADPGVSLTPPALPGLPVPTPPNIQVPLLANGSAFGAFLSSDALGVARMGLLSHWLGGAELRVGHTYLPGDSWRDIEGAPSFLDVWAHWRNERTDRMFVLNVPLQERNEDDVSDGDVRQLLRQGAAGRFDHHFRALAERLVRLKVPDTVLVLGWEMNGSTYTHRCGPDPESWKKYWNRIVTTMRSVPGQRFRFDFAPSRGLDAVAWTKCYPGDATVDILGMDSYDQPAGISFDQQVREPYGLQAHVDFAKAHGKPISYPEWGLFRNGDNAEYMQRMLAWMDEHKPLYNTLTDYCPHGVWQCAANPKSAEVYRAHLFGRTDQTAPAPVPTPSPTVPTAPPPPPACSPLDLGSWVEHWLGGKLCVRLDWWSH
ncbi:glycosyl hydrolase [Streptomyces sp. NPDC046197]|uniref:glycoside hydrolase family 26 protein n=1 Tax=Streptomyces sp. NPDC046197 TaxID=3154337 RepID=UPI0033D1D41D